jgi:hypothetical protein
MPKYLISYRKVEGAGQKPEWASFTTQSDASLEALAIKERVEKRMSVLGEQLWGDGDVIWIGAGRIDDVLYKREEAKPETSVVYGLVEE